MTDDFQQAVEDIRKKKGKTDRDRVYEILGLILLVGGSVLAFIAYFVAGSQNSGDLAIDNLEHNEHVILAIFGLTLSIVGGFVYLRYSIGRFLRFWLLRQIYESQSK
ncbi:MAG TPA: hypothetical protein QF776_06270 [Acidimicrobiales bacterium]|nr:hypothetical protein [Acidimicrobiales bacterium]